MQSQSLMIWMVYGIWNTQAKLTSHFHAERIIHFYFSQEERLQFSR
jgi:hypothetical protein